MGEMGSYIRAEFVILIPVLFFIRKALSDIGAGKALMGLAIFSSAVFLCGIYIFASVCTYTVSSVFMSIFGTLTQGIVLAGLALYGKMPMAEQENAGEKKYIDNEPHV